MFQYGALRGDRVFVQELAKFLSERYQDPVNRFVKYLWYNTYAVVIITILYYYIVTIPLL